MSLRSQIIFLLILLVFLKLYIFIIKRVIVSLQMEKDVTKINYGLVSRKDLSKVPSKTFITWCIEILEEIGFKNIHILSTNCDDSVQLLALRKLKKAYIKCVICNQNGSGNEDSFEKIDICSLQELVGTMEHDNIKYGYIITNGDFSAEAVAYAASLPEDSISLKLVDGCTLTRIHRQYQKQYIPSDLKVEVE